MKHVLVLFIYFIRRSSAEFGNDASVSMTRPPAYDKPMFNDRLNEKRDYVEFVIDSNKSSDTNDMPTEQFCMDMKSMRMVMYLGGFRFTMSSAKEMLPCLSYYVRSWVLNDKGKFKGAMVYSFLLGLVTQGLAVTRAVVFTHVQKYKVRKYLMVAIYVLQVYMGYMIMLVAMMYSAELLLSAVAGLAFGYFLFHKGETASVTPRRSNRTQEPLLAESNRA